MASVLVLCQAKVAPELSEEASGRFIFRFVFPSAGNLRTRERANAIARTVRPGPAGKQRQMENVANLKKEDGPADAR